MSLLKAFFQKVAASIRFLTHNFKGVLLLIFIIWLILPSGDKKFTPANLVRIDLVGEIHDDKILERLEEAQTNSAIKGVLLVVNSPGGGVPPSIEIAFAIRRLNAVKPVIAYASGTMASGSYYAAIWADTIIANPGSLIGSIGVIFQGFNIKEVMDKVGIAPQIVKKGRFKESGTFTRSWHDYEEQEIKSVVEDIYTMFVHDVITARQLDAKDEKIFADAHIFSAQKAKSVGLIDEVGTIYEAKALLIEKAQVSHPVWEKPTAIENFMEKLSSKIVSSIETKLFEPALK